jgi:hypothetical protein
MAWPSKNPDDYVTGHGRSGSGLTPEDEAKQLPARYRVAGGTVGLVLSVPLLLSDPRPVSVGLFFVLAGQAVWDLWWRYRLRPLVLAGVVLAGAVAGGLWSVSSGMHLALPLVVGLGVALGVLAAVTRIRTREHPIELRPQPGPLTLPLIGNVEPSKDPDDYR